MPRTGAPPITGETPTTVLAATASAMPGTARMMPMLTTGLDGGNSTKSASAIAASTPGAGAEPSAPAAVKLSAGTLACSRTHHSWKCTVLVPASSSISTWVCTSSSVIGSSVTPGCQRSQSCLVTADSGRPALSMAVRTMWVAKSLSPRLNQSGPAP